MTNVTVPCDVCAGKRYEEVPNPVPDDPTQYYTIRCRRCNGYGVLVATELKAIVTARPIDGGVWTSDGGKAP